MKLSWMDPVSRFGVVVAGVLLLAAPVFADEVDDVLALKARNRDRVHRFSAEFSVETDQPRSLPNPKTVKLRYRLTATKLPVHERAGKMHPWRMEIEVLEPGHSTLRVEGEQVWYLNPQAQWVEMEMPAAYREQFSGMSERFLGADPAEQRKHFGIRVLRRNNPIFGPRTRTLEFVSQGKARMWSRLEEDVDSDGFAVSTRLYDDFGKETVHIKVTKHQKVNGVPVMEAMETVSQTPAGEFVGRTTCTGIEVESEP